MDGIILSKQEEMKKEKIYDINPMFMVIFERWKGKWWRFWIISIILLAYLIIPSFYYKTLYFYERDQVGALEGILFITILITPFALYLMDKIYSQFEITFKKVKYLYGEPRNYNKMLRQYNNNKAKFLLWGAIIMSWFGFIINDYFHLIGVKEFSYNISNYNLLTQIILVTPHTITWVILLPIYITFGFTLVMMVLLIRDFSEKVNKKRLRYFDRKNVYGFRPLSQLTLKMAVAPLIMAIVVLWNIMISGRSIFIAQNISSIIILIIGMIVIFIYPLLRIHKLLVEQKSTALTAYSRNLENLYGKYQSLSVKSDEPEEIHELHMEINTLEVFYSNFKEIREWPFDNSIWFQFVSLILLPIIFMIIEFLITSSL